MPVVHADVQPTSAGGVCFTSVRSAWIAGPSPAEGLLREAEKNPASARRRVKPGNDERNERERTKENVGSETGFFFAETLQCPPMTQSAH